MTAKSAKPKFMNGKESNKSARSVTAWPQFLALIASAPPNTPPGAGSIPAPPPNTTKMKTSEKQLYNALSYLVIFGKQLKNTLEELTFAIEKSESLLIAHNLKPSTRLKK
jgi:hypothetical protein